MAVSCRIFNYRAPGFVVIRQNANGSYSGFDYHVAPDLPGVTWIWEDYLTSSLASNRTFGGPPSSTSLFNVPSFGRSSTIPQAIFYDQSSHSFFNVLLIEDDNGYFQELTPGQCLRHFRSMLLIPSGTICVLSRPSRRGPCTDYRKRLEELRSD